MPAIEMTSISKSYPKDGFKLNIADLKVEEGSIFGLLGPNGAGKTSLLKIIMDMVKADQGQVKIMGINHQERSVLQSRIAYMPENKDLYPHLTVGKMLDLGRRIIPEWNPVKAESLVKRFPLHKDKKISILSFGEKTQLYTILTFAKAADIYLLDEPTRGLDPVMQERMLNLIKEESSDGNTVIFSSHQIADLEETVDSLAIVKNGSIVLNGDLDDLKENYFFIAIDAQDQALLDWVLQHQDILACRQLDSSILCLGKGDQQIRKQAQEMQANLQFPKLGLKDLFITLVESEGKSNGIV